MNMLRKIWLPLMLMCALIVPLCFGQSTPSEFYFESTINDKVVGQEIIKSYQNGGLIMIESLSRDPYNFLPTLSEITLGLDKETLRIKIFEKKELVAGISQTQKLVFLNSKWWWVEDYPPFLPYYNADIDISSLNTVIDPESVGTLQIIANMYDFNKSGRQIVNCLWTGAAMEVNLEQETAPEGRLWLRIEGAKKIFLDLDPASHLIQKMTTEGNPVIKTRVEQLRTLKTIPSEPNETNGIITTPIEFTNTDGGKLRGVLLTPDKEGPFPTLLMIGEGPYGAKMAGLFESIALNLLRKSKVAVLLLNPRGINGSEGNYAEQTLENQISDVEQAMHFLKQTREVDSARIVVVGYGLGGYPAMAIAARNPLLRGCILLASPAEPYLPDLAILRQKELAKDEGWSAEKLNSNVQRIREQINMIKEIPGNWVNIAGKPYSLHFSRSCWNFDPLQSLRTMFMPVLIIHGTLDRVVPKSQAEILAKTLTENGNKNVQVELIQGLDHWLGKKNDVTKTYPAAASIDVDFRVVSILIKWIGKYVTQ